jgi:hypothetical protein
MNNVLHRSSQIFKKLLVFNGSVLFAMSLQRAVLFLLVVRHWLFGTPGSVVGDVFFTGFRFDLCVLGFISIPVLFIVWGICTDTMIASQNRTVQFLRKWSLWIYLGITTLIIHVLGLVDLFYFSTSGQRLTFVALQSQGFSFIEKCLSRWGWLFCFGIAAVFALLWVFRCLFILYRVQLHTEPLPAGTGVAGRTWILGGLLPVVVVASAARGTWTAHHLAMEHAQLTQITPLNQLALSPLCAFDKKF